MVLESVQSVAIFHISETTRPLLSQFAFYSLWNFLLFLSTKNSTMKKIVIFLFTIITFSALGQGQPRETLEPKVTEVWDLKPKKITAGAVAGAMKKRRRGRRSGIRRRACSRRSRHSRMCRLRLIGDGRGTQIRVRDDQPATK